MKTLVSIFLIGFMLGAVSTVVAQDLDGWYLLLRYWFNLLFT